MRAIYKASISFGLVNVPCRLYSATEDHSVKSHQVHAADGGAIKYHKVCDECHETVAFNEIAKQYSTDEGGTVILTEDDLSEIAADNSREIEVLEFVPAGDLDPLMYDSSYFLGPDGGTKAYVLLAGVLAQSDRVAIVRLTMRGKSHLAALRIVGKGNVMAIHTLKWPDEIRQPDFPELDKAPRASEAEMKVAAQLVGAMEKPFNPDAYRDTCNDELRELIEAKAAESSDDKDGTEEVSELLAKLEASTAAVKPKPKRSRKPKVSMLAGVAS
jgi:DNA end-binding protein Ku